MCCMENIRATICASVDAEGELDLAEAWLAEHAGTLTHVSDGGGCGCCIVLWNVEGPAAVIDTLPPQLATDSDWVGSATR
jgi:hypothetical protein